MNPNSTLKLKFIETYLRDGAESDEYSVLKGELYRTGYNASQVIDILVEGKLYGTLDTFYQKHPALHLN